MKKRSFFLTLLMLAFLVSITLYDSAAQNAAAQESIKTVKPFTAQTTVYGLIKENAVLLNNEFSAVTSLPATYFVVITDETASHYSVTYLDLNGLIDKNQIEKVDYEPKNKFASAYFTASNDTHPVNIRSAPAAGASVTAVIPDGTKAFLYGFATGDALIGAAGNKWHYVRYNDGTNRYGYVYSAQGSADNFAVNIIEKVESAPSDSDTNPPTNEGGGGGGSFDWLYILLLCIPAVIIMLALFSRPKKTADNAQD